MQAMCIKLSNFEYTLHITLKTLLRWTTKRKIHWHVLNTYAALDYKHTRICKSTDCSNTYTWRCVVAPTNCGMFWVWSRNSIHIISNWFSVLVCAVLVDIEDGTVVTQSSVTRIKKSRYPPRLLTAASRYSYQWRKERLLKQSNPAINHIKNCTQV